jgi:hypothetical protein
MSILTSKYSNKKNILYILYIEVIGVTELVFSTRSVGKKRGSVNSPILLVIT